jgi:hypothetical protein
VFPSLLHQDPRYFYQGSGTVKSHFMHAISSADQSSESLPLYPNDTDPNYFAQTLRIFLTRFLRLFLRLNGLDNGVNSRPTYSKSSHCSTILDIQTYSTSHRLPYVVEIDYDGPAILRQPPDMDFTPASNVPSHPFTGRL